MQAGVFSLRPGVAFFIVGIVAPVGVDLDTGIQSVEWFCVIHQ